MIVSLDDKAEEFLCYYRDKIEGSNVSRFMEQESYQRVVDYQTRRFLGDSDVPEFYSVALKRGDGKKALTMIRGRAFQMGEEKFSMAQVIQQTVF